jgi:hypothetical protein
MRTTLDIDEDVLDAAKNLAEVRKTTAGKVISELARQALQPRKTPKKFHLRNGVPLLPFKRGGKVVTMELVNKLRDEDE